MTKLPIGVTTGDHFGIGPEVIAKGLKLLKKQLKNQTVVLFADPSVYRRFAPYLPKNYSILAEELYFSGNLPLPKSPLVFVNPDIPKKFKRSRRSRADYLSGRYIELATRAALEGKVAGIVTGPIDKTALQRAGYRYNGHTEMLADLCSKPNAKVKVTMMLASQKLRITLVTGHLPLARVSKAITGSAIEQCVLNTVKGLQSYFNIKKPRIAILGLNPHAGDNGLFGMEEISVIIPEIKRLTKLLPGVKIKGPFAADGFFALWQQRHIREYDAIVALYHDQGLIPAKLYDFQNMVNVTLGLPVIRTSVDHGVGYDIAGKDQADPSSFCAALEMALQIARLRHG